MGNLKGCERNCMCVKSTEKETGDDTLRMYYLLIKIVQVVVKGSQAAQVVLPVFPVQVRKAGLGAHTTLLHVPHSNKKYPYHFTLPCLPAPSPPSPRSGKGWCWGKTTFWVNRFKKDPAYLTSLYQLVTPD